MNEVLEKVETTEEKSLQDNLASFVNLIFNSNNKEIQRKRVDFAKYSMFDMIIQKLEDKFNVIYQHVSQEFTSKDYLVVAKALYMENAVENTKESYINSLVIGVSTLLAYEGQVIADFNQPIFYRYLFDQDYLHKNPLIKNNPIDVIAGQRHLNRFIMYK